MNYLLKNVLLITAIYCLSCGERSTASPVSLTQDLPTESFCSSLVPTNGKRLPASSYSIYRENSSFTGPVFLEYVHAVAYTESHFDPRVRSNRDAYGLMQITEIAMREASAFCHIPVLKSMSKLLDPAVNIKYGTCYLKFLLEQTEEDYVRALIIYNGGYRALTLYEKGGRVFNETAQYVLSVDRVRKMCTSTSATSTGVLK